MRPYVVFLFVLVLSGCFTPEKIYLGENSMLVAQDLCPKLEPFIQKSLTDKSGGQIDPVINIENLSSGGFGKPLFENNWQSSQVTCHAKIVHKSGFVEYGVVQSYVDKNDNVQVAWRSNQSISEAELKIQEDADKANWKKFKGDIATWSGVPPLPPSASRIKTQVATSNCHIRDAVFNKADIWASPNDCAAWIRGAQELAATAPSPQEVEIYFMTKCSQSLSGYGRPAFSRHEFDNQSYICAQAFQALKTEGRPISFWPD